MITRADQITSRRQALKAGNWHGLASSPGISASEASGGWGIDARSVPRRWQSVFEAAFKRARRSLRI